MVKIQIMDNESIDTLREEIRNLRKTVKIFGSGLIALNLLIHFPTLMSWSYAFGYYVGRRF